MIIKTLQEYQMTQNIHGIPFLRCGWKRRKMQPLNRKRNCFEQARQNPIKKISEYNQEELDKFQTQHK